MILDPQRTDEEYVAELKKRVRSLNMLLHHCAADGLTVELKIGVGRGAERGHDRSTTFADVELTNVYRRLV